MGAPPTAGARACAVLELRAQPRPRARACRLQGNDSRYTKVAATCKHFAAYSLEEWEGTSRLRFDAQLDPRWVLA